MVMKSPCGILIFLRSPCGISLLAVISPTAQVYTGQQRLSHGRQVLQAVNRSYRVLH